MGFVWFYQFEGLRKRVLQNQWNVVTRFCNTLCLEERQLIIFRSLSGLHFMGCGVCLLPGIPHFDVFVVAVISVVLMEFLMFVAYDGVV